MPHILLNAACDLKFLSDSTCTNLWSYSSITPCLSYIRYMYTDYAYCINLSWIKYMYICVFANKVAGNRELNYKHWQLFWLKHSRFKPFISFSNAKKMSCLFKFKSHKILITCIGMYLAIISYLTKVNYLLILCCVNFYFIPCMHLKNSKFSGTVCQPYIP